jgi:hypothetical protein
MWEGREVKYRIWDIEYKEASVVSEKFVALCNELLRSPHWNSG